MNPFDDARHLAALEEGSRAHYAEPSYYTKCYRGRSDDVAFYTELVAKSKPASVLEYGCGNGRIALPLARAGTPVTGVDLSEAMLADFQARLDREPAEVARRVSLVRGDMREAKLRRRFPLVLCTFNTFLHLYSRQDVEAFLARVRQHMQPDARFVFDATVPSIVEIGRDPNRAYTVPRMRYPATGELVRYAEYFDYDVSTQVLTVTMRFEPHQDPKRAWTTLLTHRQYFPRELEALLHYNGFEVEQILPDFAEGTIEPDTDIVVWVTKLRRGADRTG